MFSFRNDIISSKSNDVFLKENNIMIKNNFIEKKDKEDPIHLQSEWGKNCYKEELKYFTVNL